MNIGKLQRRWQETKPAVFDKETRMVCMDIQAEKRKDGYGEDTVEKDGWSFIAVQIDTLMDYSHIKSQLIEAGFAQKDEFGLLMNAVDDILEAVTSNTTIAGFKAAIDTEDVKAFRDFCAFREMCAEAAREVMAAYN